MTYDGATALHLACVKGNVRSIECLVGYGAAVELTDDKGLTPLHYVIAQAEMKPLSEWTRHLNEVRRA